MHHILNPVIVTLRDERTYYGISTEALALALNIHPTTLNNYEVGRYTPTIPILERWALLLGMNLRISITADPTYSGPDIKPYKAGVKLPMSRGDFNKHLAEIIRLRNSGLSNTQIATKTNRAVRNIREALRRYGHLTPDQALKYNIRGIKQNSP